MNQNQAKEEMKILTLKGLGTLIGSYYQSRVDFIFDKDHSFILPGHRIIDLTSHLFFYSFCLIFYLWQSLKGVNAIDVSQSRME